MIATLQLTLNENLYLRDPQETDLGRKIISSGIKLIDEIGFEAFTFKKLANGIDSTEASIYRYFENKHRLLIYLNTWYWTWLEYTIDYRTNNIPDNERKLEIALEILAEQKKQDELFPDIDEEALQRIIIAESDKTYLTKQVDEDNKEGLFRGYKSLCKKVADFVKQINPQYGFAHALISTVLEASHQQLFFAEHLPSLTELSEPGINRHQENFEFIRQLVQNAIKI